MSNPEQSAPSPGAAFNFPMVRMPSAARDWLLFDGFPVDGNYPFSEVTIDDINYRHLARNMFVPEDATPAEVESVYDYWAPEYDQQHPWTPQYGEHAIRFTRMPRGPVVDLGTGTGMVLEGLAAAGVPPQQLTGIDASPAMLSRAAEKTRTGTLQGAQLLQLNLAEHNLLDVFPPGSVDLITASYSLSHLPPATWEGLLTSISSLLAPGGHFIVIDSLSKKGSVAFRQYVHEFFGGRDENYRVVHNGLSAQVVFPVGYQVVWNGVL